MSEKIVAQALKLDAIAPVKLVLIALAREASSKGYVVPVDIEELCQSTGEEAEYVISCLREALELGLVRARIFESEGEVLKSYELTFVENDWANDDDPTFPQQNKGFDENESLAQEENDDFLAQYDLPTFSDESDVLSHEVRELNNISFLSLHSTLNGNSSELDYNSSNGVTIVTLEGKESIKEKEEKLAQQAPLAQNLSEDDWAESFDKTELAEEGEASSPLLKVLNDAMQSHYSRGSLWESMDNVQKQGPRRRKFELTPPLGVGEVIGPGFKPSIPALYFRRMRWICTLSDNPSERMKGRCSAAVKDLWARGKDLNRLEDFEEEWKKNWRSKERDTGKYQPPQPEQVADCWDEMLHNVPASYSIVESAGPTGMDLEKPIVTYEESQRIMRQLSNETMGTGEWEEN